MSLGLFGFSFGITNYTNFLGAYVMFLTALCETSYFKLLISLFIQFNPCSLIKEMAIG